MEESVMIDPSILFDSESLERLEYQMREFETLNIYIPNGIWEFVDYVEQYPEYRKSAIPMYFKGSDIPPIDSVRRILDSEHTERYGPYEERYDRFEEFELYEEIQNATSYYQRYPGYEKLITTLVEEVNYLFTNSIISAAKEKIVDLFRRINAAVLEAREDVTERVKEEIVRAQNLYHDEEEEIIGLFKWTLIGVTVTQIQPMSGVIAFVVGASLGDRIVVALDP